MKRLANLFLVLAVIITIGSNISFAKAEDYSQQETIEAIRQSFIKVGNEALLKQVKSIIQTSPWVEENPSGAYPIGNKVEVDLIFDFDGVCTKQPTTFIRLNLGGMLSEDVMMFDSQDSVDFDCGALAAEAASDAQQKAEELAAELRRQAE